MFYFLSYNDIAPGTELTTSDRTVHGAINELNIKVHRYIAKSYNTPVNDSVTGFCIFQDCTDGPTGMWAISFGYTLIIDSSWWGQFVIGSNSALQPILAVRTHTVSGGGTWRSV